MEFLLILGWGSFLCYIAMAPKETMQATWVILIALILISPLFAWLWPGFR